MRVYHDFSSALFFRGRATGDTIRRVDESGGVEVNRAIRFRTKGNVGILQEYAQGRRRQEAKRPFLVSLQRDVGKIFFDDNFTTFSVVVAVFVLVFVLFVEIRSSDLDLEANYSMLLVSR